MIPSLCSSPPVVDKGAGPGVMKVGELFLPLTGCSSWESRPYTLPGHKIITYLGGGGTGELVHRHELRRDGLLHLSAMRYGGHTGYALSPDTSQMAELTARL